MEKALDSEFDDETDYEELGNDEPDYEELDDGKLNNDQIKKLLVSGSSTEYISSLPGLSEQEIEELKKV